MRSNPEEFVPMGVAGGLTHLPVGFQRTVHDLSDCLVTRPRPFRLVIWEPLPTKAPAPPKAQAFCCYINTVIFYHFPYIVRRGAFIEWDQIRTRTLWDDLLEFEGERFTIGSGTVLWKRRRWWMLRHARRAQR